MGFSHLELDYLITYVFPCCLMYKLTIHCFQNSFFNSNPMKQYSVVLNITVMPFLKKYFQHILS